MAKSAFERLGPLRTVQSKRELGWGLGSGQDHVPWLFPLWEPGRGSPNQGSPQGLGLEYVKRVALTSVKEAPDRWGLQQWLPSPPPALLGRGPRAAKRAVLSKLPFTMKRKRKLSPSKQQSVLQEFPRITPRAVFSECFCSLHPSWISGHMSGLKEVSGCGGDNTVEARGVRLWPSPVRSSKVPTHKQ